MTKSKFKVLFYYKNIKLWKNISILNTKKKKWTNLKNNSKGKYVYHYKKLKIENLYNYKFINKQILRKYLTISTNNEFKTILKTNYLNFEKRLDFNLYHANFVTSLYAAKFFITKGCVFVNKRKITSFNYLLKKNDIIEINHIFYNYIIRNISFTNFTKKNYIRNLEIDYKTFSFIFLDNINYYILNYNNFIKKIYIRQHHNVINPIYINSNMFNYNYNIYNLRNKSLCNNYFNFFRHIYIYYIWLDKKNQYFKYKNIHYESNYALKLFSKLLQRKYNNYYFRNILLKRIFNYKYNYLRFLQKTKIFNTYFIFQNIDTILNSNLQFVDTHLQNQNYFSNELFKYIYTLIFQYYIYLIKNYYLNTIINNMNDYTVNLIFNQKIFKLINIKNKLYNYIRTKSHVTVPNINSNLIFKTLDYKLIKTYQFKNISYKRPLVYKKLICYILSKKYKYRIYRKCHSFRQNKIRRLYLIEKLKKSFTYTKYNGNKTGSSLKLITKNTFYNKLILIKKKTTETKRINYKINNLYYPQYGQIYNTIFKTLILSLKADKQALIKNRHKIWNLRKQFTNYTNMNELKNYLYTYELNITARLNFIKYNKIKNNLNFNVYYKDLFLIQNFISYLILQSNKNYNLKYFKNLIFYKIYYKYNLNQKQPYTNKKYRRLAFYYRRFLLNYYYINYNKSKITLASNLRKYFLLTHSFQNLTIKAFYNNYKHYYLKRRKYYFKPLQHYRYINYKSRTLKKTKFAITYKKYSRFNRMYYLTKNRQTNQKFIQSNANQNIFYYMNLNLINSKFKFNNNLFYIDMLLNLYIRKLNTNYNTLLYTNLTKIKHNTYNIYTNAKLLKKYKHNSVKHYNVSTCNTFSLRYMRNYCLTNNYFNYQTGYINNRNFYHYNLYVKLHKLFYKNNHKIFTRISKKDYINNMYKIYLYYTFNLRKYKLIRYIFTNYILKEYTYFINLLFSNLTLKTYNKSYIKQLYYNLLFSQLFNIDKFDYILKNNYNYSRNLKIIINYFIIINRLYK